MNMHTINDRLREIVAYVATMGDVDPEYALACVGQAFGIPADACAACGQKQVPEPEDAAEPWKPYKDD